MYCDLPNLYGPFKDIMPGYVAYKRSLGCKYGNTILQRLKEIDRFFGEHGVTDVAVSEDGRPGAGTSVDPTSGRGSALLTALAAISPGKDSRTSARVSTQKVRGSEPSSRTSLPTTR
jgi:hypothetical protein